jgi:hypothetical protein
MHAGSQPHREDGVTHIMSGVSRGISKKTRTDLSCNKKCENGCNAIPSQAHSSVLYRIGKSPSMAHTS